MADIRQSINLPPDETVEYFRAKGYATQEHWDKLWQEDHNRAFTVTKMMNRDLLEATRASLDKVLSKGGTFEMWKADIQPKMDAAGWWGKVQDPDITGVDHPVFIGESRLRTIYDTNLRVARAAGKWKRIQALKAMAPYLLYDAINDRRTRPLHRKWGGLDTGNPIILLVDHPAWLIYFPPCGWGCRCGVIQLSDRDMRRRGLRITSDEELRTIGWMAADGTIGGGRAPWRRSDGEIVQVPAGVDPGFAYNPGVDYQRALSPMPMIEGDILQPLIVGRALMPMPLPRPAPSADILPPDVPPTEAARRFLDSFGVTGESKTFYDEIGEPVVISSRMVEDAGGNLKAGKLGRGQYALLAARALREPDEIWETWVLPDPAREARTGKSFPPRLRRRYVARFLIDGESLPIFLVVDIGKDGWVGRTWFSPAKGDAYLDRRVRGGTLRFRRGEGPVL